ncbi:MULTISPECIES: WXG100 family type VII secretion target [Amycolatopsis]|uniref:ESAT-6-like protein n=2 Tax=Amycolatopsis TaxID=1813 RepID=A0A2A9FB36_9PSEU|nr:MULTISPECIES: WXG100 family type VII secretion target [Amycolatopsis]PFG48637.1 WXG100 family type VII secretion target [Amycolatopsis sulphurea]RJQ85766.1 WXG100 family type VII secretion target [Amycolatopsis panacis]
MALGQFQISFAQMQDTVGQAKQQSNQITELLDQMKAVIDGQREQWTGVAADMFNETYTFCHQAALTLPQALDAASQTLGSINEGTSTTEGNNAKRFAAH